MRRSRAPGGGGGASLRLLFIAIVLCLASLTFAHPANVASAQAKVSPDGTFITRIRFDISAFATNSTPKEADDVAMNALLDGSDDALKAALVDAEARFRTEFSSGGTIDRLEFPTVADIRRFLSADPKPRLPVMLMATVTGHLPSAARTIAFRYPSTFDTVIQTVEFPYREPISEPVERNQTSTALKIPTQTEVDRLAAAINAPRPAEPPVKKAPVLKVAPVAIPKPTVAAKPVPTVPVLKPIPKAVVPKVERSPDRASEPKPAPKSIPVKTSAANPVVTYLRMGFTHILPEGIDHILFVLGLFLLGSNAKALLKQVTAFTLAHSITLALAALNLVRLPGSVIEPLIAISIAFVAIENLFMKEVRPWRTAVVFLFGLVHGMGFAEVFADAGLRGGGLLAALVSFNVGVELGQLSVIGLALVAVGWFRKDERYRKWVVVPGSISIAIVALFWTVERIFG